MQLQKLSYDHYLLIFIVAALSVNFAWFYLDNSLPMENGGEHLVIVSSLIRDQGPELTGKYFHLANPYLKELIYFQYYRLLGTSAVKGHFVNLLFLLILMLGIYKIGETLHSKRAGLLASIIAGTMPLVLNAARNTFSEFQILAFTVLTYWMMLKTDRFRSLKYSIALAITVAMTLLIKYSAVVYIAPFLAVYTVMALWKKNKAALKPTLINMLACGAIILIVSAPWYLEWLRLISDWIIRRIFVNDVEIGKNVTGSFAANIFYHLKELTFNNAGILLGALFIFFTIVPKKKDYVLLSAFWITYAIFIFIPIKGPALLLPEYFVVAIVVAKGISDMKGTAGWLMRIVVVCVGMTILLFPFYSYKEIFLYSEFPAKGTTCLDDRFPTLREPQKSDYLPEGLFHELESDKDQLILSTVPEFYWKWIYLNNIYRSNISVTAVMFPEGPYFAVWSHNSVTFDNLTYIDGIRNRRYSAILRILPDNGDASLFGYHHSYLAIDDINANYRLLKTVTNQRREPMEIYVLKNDSASDDQPDGLAVQLN